MKSSNHESGKTLNLTEQFRRGIELHQAGRLNEAGAIYDQIAGLAPEHPEVLHWRGVLAFQQGRNDDAVTLLEAAIARNADNPQYYNNLGTVYNFLGRYDKAIQCFLKVLSFGSGSTLEALLNLGSAYRSLGKVSEALSYFQRAVLTDPTNFESWNNLGVCLVECDESADAAHAFTRALALYPAFIDATYNLSVALKNLSRHEEAILFLERVLSLEKKLPAAVSLLMQQKRAVCDWDGLDGLYSSLLETVNRGEGEGITPFTLLYVPCTPKDQLRGANLYVRNTARQAAALRTSLNFRYPRKGGGKIRLGYLSADFHNHATAILIAEIFELHDRSRFEVFAYSYGRADDGNYRKRIMRTSDAFIDIFPLSAPEAATRIHSDGIDILLDLKGHSHQARLMIPALRPAPVIVNYLGYPGTIGGDFFDYLVADEFIIPKEYRDCYSEKIACMPNTYQITDTRRIIPAPPSRSELGLTQDAFVFCCLNNVYKITPDVFAVWTQILGAVPDSVLWLLSSNAAAGRNLQAQAASRGVSPERIVFSPITGHSEHLARLTQADLFLDTLPINGHTLASDSLWAGLPFLTVTGESFAARVAGSVLKAANLGELVTGSLPEYRDKALYLARNRGYLKELRRKLEGSLNTIPLFDNGRYVADFENLLTRMHERRLKGLPPASLE